MADVDKNHEFMKQLVNSFNDPDQKVRRYTFEQVASLSGCAEGRELIVKSDSIRHLIRRIGDSDLNVLKNVMTCLINISQFENLAKLLVERNVVRRLMDELLSPELNVQVFSLYTVLLSNLTRFEFGVRKFLNMDDGNDMLGFYANKLIQIFVKKSTDNLMDFSWIGQVILNATVLDHGRRIIMANDMKILKILMSQIESKSNIRRQSVLGIVLNCLISTEDHEKILQNNEIDLVTKLCFLIRGEHVLDETERDEIPSQLIPPRGSIESDMACKKLIIDIFTSLVKTKFGRDYMKNFKVYPLVREWHSIEHEEDLKMDIYEFIHFLVLDDPEVVDRNEHDGESQLDVKKISVDRDEHGDQVEEL